MMGILLLQLAAVLALTNGEMSYKDTLLKLHNKARAAHDKTRRLTWNDEIAKFAQTWCDYLAGTVGKLKHSPGATNISLPVEGRSVLGIGENLAWYWTSRNYDSGSDDEATFLLNSATTNFNNWYNEIGNYNFITGRSNGGATGHFTQVVWRKSTELGCGVSLKSGSGTSSYLCCNYRSPGNYNSAYLQNVGKLTGCYYKGQVLCAVDNACVERGETCSDGSEPAGGAEIEECSRTALQKDYRGKKATTESGTPCQKWTSQSPHKHGVKPVNNPGAGLGDHNYCRNPDGESVGAWCYTTDPSIRWKACGVPRCEKGDQGKKKKNNKRNKNNKNKKKGGNTIVKRNLPKTRAI